MNLLSIDTSNQAMGVALLNDDVLIGEMVTNIKRNHSVQLMPAINQLMRETGMTPDDLDKIAVAKGPGSFTGVRIGLATAKAMAWSLQIPIVGVSSLEVLAYQGYLSNMLISPFFDARRGNIYTGLYQWEDGMLRSVEPEQNPTMLDWLRQLAAEKQPILFLSPDIKLYQSVILENTDNFAIIPPSSFHLAKPSHLAFAALDKTPEPTHTLAPNYLRLAEAEAKWQREQKGKTENG